MLAIVIMARCFSELIGAHPNPSPLLPVVARAIKAYHRLRGQACQA